MALLPKKDFCLWIVPTDDGRVRKLRFTATKALFYISLMLLTSALLLFIVGDYGRVQLLRAKSYFSIQSLETEKAKLEHGTSELKSQIEELKDDNQRVRRYEEGLKRRISEIGEIISSAASLGVIPGKAINPSSKDLSNNLVEGVGAKNIGGAELDCKDCDPSVGNAISDQTESTSARLSYSESMGLLVTLDEYASILERIPLSSPANGHVSSNFGYRRSPFGGKWKMHQGIDFALAGGSNIYVTANGVVKRVKRTPTYGLVVDVEHSNSVLTRYAHLSKVLVKEGQELCRGQSVGLVGSTGRSTGPHLHYEIRVNKKAINPNKVLDLAYQLAKLSD